ncbi:sensor histidine kinase [Vallitalea sp. AN17-2]|uniref:Sensor histidine kinase n=1 Tax=Vallitalea maricola TaxID=3074433 RepID=A0ACB5UHK9_9FIRM|nr:sensor histidine kinase [Vallitalea sp. AN17-2]
MLRRMYTTISRHIRNMKIFYKLMWYIIFIGMIPIITFSISSYKNTHNQVEHQLFQSSEQLFNKYIDGIQFKLNVYENLTWGIIVNDSVQKILSEADRWQQKDVNKVHEKISKNIDIMYKSKRVNGIYNIMLYSLDPNFPRDGHSVSNISMISEETWGNKMNIDSKEMTTFFYEVPTLDDNIVSIVRPIIDIASENWNIIGLLKIDILDRELFGLNKKTDNDYKNSLYILDDENKLVYYEGDLQYKKDGLQTINSLHTKNNTLTYRQVLQNKDVVFYKKVNRYNWRVFFVTHYSSIYEVIENETKSIVIYGIIVTFLVILITILFSKKFSSRIQVLYKKMLKVQKGDLEITENVIGEDEIGELDNYFNGSIEKIKSLIRENYIEKIEKREAELVALQFQINPHFLYNTLESINYIAEIYDCNEISIMSQKLGEMFRYSLNKDSEEFVMFYQEENHIRNYIDIQNIRFDDKYSIITNVSEEIKKYKILKFILQPIVENAIKYGFRNREKGTIKIEAEVVEKYLIMTVTDNGIGMSEEMLLEINEFINDMSFNLDQTRGKSIGLRNVNLRIKMTCGDEYGIDIKSVMGKGTKVIYKLPIYL